MTTEQTTQRRQPCEREGCPGISSEGNRFCCFICRAIEQELENTQRICEALGNSELTTELWTEAVAMSDACSRYLELGYRLRMLAKDVGITSNQWHKIRKGRAVSAQVGR